MTRSKRAQDPENPPAQRESDFTGAEVLPAGARHARPVSSLRFHVFRASQDPDLFAVTDSDDSSKLPSCPAGAWTLFRVVPETGKPRVGFSEAEAKRDIVARGHHLVRVRVLVKARVGRT